MKQPQLMVEEGWTTEQKSRLERAWFQVQPTATYFWKEVSRKVPGKSAQECYDCWNSAVKTPPRPRTSSSSSLGITLAPSEPTSKKPKSGKGNQCNRQRELLKKQSMTVPGPKGSRDLFSVLEPEYCLSTESVQNVECRNDQARPIHSLRGSHDSPPVLKSIKNEASHWKYVDQLIKRNAKRNAASKRATQGKNDAKEQVHKVDVIRKAKSSLRASVRSLEKLYSEGQSNIMVDTDDADDGNKDSDDRDEDEIDDC